LRRRANTALYIWSFGVKIPLDPGGVISFERAQTGVYINQYFTHDETLQKTL
jgi:hypothetical protein